MCLDAEHGLLCFCAGGIFDGDGVVDSCGGVVDSGGGVAVAIAVAVNCCRWCFCPLFLLVMIWEVPLMVSGNSGGGSIAVAVVVVAATVVVLLLMLSLLSLLLLLLLLSSCC